MNGEYLKSQERYEPVRNKDGAITGFRQMSAYLHQFSGEEQKLIFQYALNYEKQIAGRSGANLKDSEKSAASAARFRYL